MDDFFSRHEKVGMMFSAGKDSAACLYLTEKWWEKITFIWGNPGNPYPETVEYMEGIRNLVPNFLEVRGEQPEFIRRYGYPVDVLPIYAAVKGMRVVPFSLCCASNLWSPTLKAVFDNKITGLIRGQKRADSHTSSAKSGDIVDEVEYLHPLENWTDGDVLSYLGDRIPPSYSRVKTSLDCMNCTAYADQERIRDLENIDLHSAAEIRGVHFELVQTLSPLMKALNG